MGSHEMLASAVGQYIFSGHGSGYSLFAGHKFPGGHGMAYLEFSGHENPVGHASCVDGSGQ